MLIKRGDESFSLLLRALDRRQVAAMACDTIYGFVGVAPDTEAMLRRLKGSEGPFLTLISDVTKLKDFDVRILDHSILSLWPGPFTFVFALADGGTIALRVPHDEWLKNLLDAVGLPLFSTSANRSGQALMENPLDIEHEFGDSIALVEDCGIFSQRLPSTVVDLRKRPFSILRQGAGIIAQNLLR